MKSIVNLTNHNATESQIKEGVFDLKDSSQLKKLITFSNLPTQELLSERATEVAKIAQESGAKYAMIGGAPYFMTFLEKSLKEIGVIPLYSFTERKSIETSNPDGTVSKTAIFEHIGFVEV